MNEIHALRLPARLDVVLRHGGGIHDQLGLMRHITKWAERIRSPQEAPTLVSQAIAMRELYANVAKRIGALRSDLSQAGALPSLRHIRPRPAWRP